MPQVLEESDLDGDGALNFEEFQRAVAHSDIRAKLTIMF
jgi:Ca2+-binding EF-hand superfamily protein